MWSSLDFLPLIYFKTNKQIDEKVLRQIIRNPGRNIINYSRVFEENKIPYSNIMKLGYISLETRERETFQRGIVREDLLVGPKENPRTLFP